METCGPPIIRLSGSDTDAFRVDFPCHLVGTMRAEPLLTRNIVMTKVLHKTHMAESSLKSPKQEETQFCLLSNIKQLINGIYSWITLDNCMSVFKILMKNPLLKTKSNNFCLLAFSL